MNDIHLREQVVAVLKGHAHMGFEEAIKNFPEKHINTMPPNGDYTFWHLVEHIRRTQWDIIDFIKNPKYVEPEWPKDYWPKKSEKATKVEWNKSVKAVQKNLEEMIAIVEDPKTDLFAKVP